MPQSTETNHIPEAYNLIVQKWDDQMAAELVDWSFHNVREPYGKFFQSLVQAHQAKTHHLKYLEKLLSEQQPEKTNINALHAFEIWIGCRVIKRSLLMDPDSLLEQRDWSLCLSLNTPMPHPSIEKKWQWAWIAKENELKRNQIKRYKARGLNPQKVLKDEKILEGKVNAWMVKRN